ncbi:MAG: hypothetical protein K8R77_00855 [Anaerolineaceae bacterium]|nr:hypothetical protein [Anaerolineaceae bacterium]
MKDSKAVELINLVGIVVALATLGVDPWAVTAPGAEGLKIGLALFFSLEAICVYLSMRSGRREWLRIQFSLSLLVLAALMGALFIYEVKGEGVMVMIVIGLMTTETSLMMSFLSSDEVRVLKRFDALEKLSIDWQLVAQQAATSNTPLSVLSVHTMRPITKDVFSMLEKELRSKDLLIMLDDGLFILLWDTLPAVASQVGNKMRNFIMEQAHVESWIGIASYPLHDERMKPVLEYAEEALHAARAVDGPSVVVYGYTTRADTMASLEKDWESLLDIAKENQQSVSVLAITTSQPLRTGMADLIQREFRTKDVIASVPNGFYVFLFKADEHVVARVADRVEEALRQWGGIQSWVGTSSYPGDGESIGALLRHAERNTQRLAYGEYNSPL